MILISGKGETSSRLPGPLAYSSPEAVHTTGTVAFLDLEIGQLASKALQHG
jgi:hypothetical protein